MYILIFICLGSQQYQFNRLLKTIDYMVENKQITEEIFAQTGSSDYQPQNYQYQSFLSQEEYEKKVINATLIITHGGTGAIIKALKADKQVIVVPRQAKYDEHADDHQFQITEFMFENGYVHKVIEMEELFNSIKLARTNPIYKKFVSTGNVVEIIEHFIESN